MLERDVTPLIDRIIARAHIARRAEREDLRRELLAHFEDACEGPSGVSGAIERFGSEALLVQSWRDVHRRDYLLLYCSKIAVSLAACVAAALAIQVLVNLRVALAAEAWRLGPNFSRAAAMSVGVVLGLVAAREIGRRPLSMSRAAVAILGYAVLCLTFQFTAPASMGPFITATIMAGAGSASAKLGPWSARLLGALFGFAMTLYLRHLNLKTDFGAIRATLVGCEYLAVWASTLLILSRCDTAFRSVLSRQRTT